MSDKAIGVRNLYKIAVDADLESSSKSYRSIRQDIVVSFSL
jgi:hypothetical protein